jgi:hypothetical protein
MRRGRPTSTRYAKDRRHTVILNEKAEILFRQVCRDKGGQEWFNRLVSERIVDVYGDDYRKTLLTQILNDLQHQRNELEAKISEVADEIKKHKENKQDIVSHDNS